MRRLRSSLLLLGIPLISFEFCHNCVLLFCFRFALHGIASWSGNRIPDDFCDNCAKVSKPTENIHATNCCGVCVCRWVVRSWLLRRLFARFQRFSFVCSCVVNTDFLHADVNWWFDPHRLSSKQMNETHEYIEFGRLICLLLKCINQTPTFDYSVNFRLVCITIRTEYGCMVENPHSKRIGSHYGERIQ